MRSRTGEISAAAFAVALLVCMFAFAWFGVDEIPGTSAARGGVVRTEDAWHAFSVLRWIMLLTIAAALTCAGVPWVRERVGPRGRGALVTALGCTTAVLLVVRVLIELPSSDRVPDQKLGAVVGMLCGVGIALGGWETVRHAGAEPGRPRAGDRHGRVAETSPGG